MRDFGYEAQQAAEAHLAAIAEAEEMLDEDPDAAVDHPATGLWDGCDTCVVREVLAAAWPIFLEGISELLIEAGHADAEYALAALLS